MQIFKSSTLFQTALLLNKMQHIDRDCALKANGFFVINRSYLFQVITNIFDFYDFVKLVDVMQFVSDIHCDCNVYNDSDAIRTMGGK